MRVYRVTHPGEVRGGFLRHILQLADGRSVEEIAQRLYLDALRSGGWLSDIGLWRKSFIKDVTSAVNLLAEQGHVRLEASGPVLEDTPFP